jgi:hypothetical protein
MKKILSLWFLSTLGLASVNTVLNNNFNKVAAVESKLEIKNKELFERMKKHVENIKIKGNDYFRTNEINWINKDNNAPEARLSCNTDKNTMSIFLDIYGDSKLIENKTFYVEFFTDDKSVAKFNLNRDSRSNRIWNIENLELNKFNLDYKTYLVKLYGDNEKCLYQGNVEIKDPKNSIPNVFDKSGNWAVGSYVSFYIDNDKNKDIINFEYFQKGVDSNIYEPIVKQANSNVTVYFYNSMGERVLEKQAKLDDRSHLIFEVNKNEIATPFKAKDAYLVEFYDSNNNEFLGSWVWSI